VSVEKLRENEYATFRNKLVINWQNFAEVDPNSSLLSEYVSVIVTFYFGDF